MSSPIEYLDILFFALIAVFIFLRLRHVLGQRTHHDEGHEQPGLERAQQPESVDATDQCRIVSGHQGAAAVERWRDRIGRT